MTIGKKELFGDYFQQQFENVAFIYLIDLSML